MSVKFIDLDVICLANLVLRCCRQDFFIKPKYQNTLPDIPCDPKHLLIPPDLKNFQLTFTELRPLYEQITDWNVGVAVDLVGKTFDFTLPKDSKCPEDELHPVDKLLLQPEVDEDNNGGVHNYIMYNDLIETFKHQFSGISVCFQISRLE